MELLIVAVLGLAGGSFVNALVWRIHEQEELKDKKGKLKKGNVKEAKELSILKGRSMCPNCRHELAAKDLVPVLSWLSLNGKCRYCKKPIHWQYPVVEAITATLFIISYIIIDPPLTELSFGMLEFLVWLVLLTGLVALTIYDLKWMILPNRIVYPMIIIAFVLRFIEAGFVEKDFSPLISAFFGGLLLGGLFYLLFIVSKGKWIGGGDVKLGLFIGVLVGPLLAYFVLLVASLVGSIITVLLTVSKSIKFNQPVPFGPYLIGATYIAVVWGDRITEWYERTFLIGIF